MTTATLDYDRHAFTELDWTNALPSTYSPPDLVTVANGTEPSVQAFAVAAPQAADRLVKRGDQGYAQVLSDARNALIRKVAFADLVAMREAAARSGHRIVVVSAFRSYVEQEATFSYWVGVGGYAQALRTSARPGHSEHQLGTTIDFGDGIAAPWEYDDWATTAPGAWLAQHAAEYGFVMTLARGASDVTCYDYEPWHYRWVGHEIAMQFRESRLVYRDYQTRLH